MKIITLGLAAALALSACGKDKKPAAKADDKPTATESATPGDKPAAPAAGSGEKKADDKGGW